MRGYGVKIIFWFGIVIHSDLVVGCRRWSCGVVPALNSESGVAVSSCTHLA